MEVTHWSCLSIERYVGQNRVGRLLLMRYEFISDSVQLDLGISDSARGESTRYGNVDVCRLDHL